MPRATIHATDTEDGRVRVEIEADRDIREIPEAERTPAERCAVAVFAELEALAAHLPQLSTEDGHE